MLYIYNNLKYLREKLKLSRNSFANKLDINVSNISRWENNKNGMGLETANIIAEKLGIPLADIIGKDLTKEELDLSSIIDKLNKKDDKND